MALSANTRKLNEYQDLVLYLDIRWNHDGTRMDSFLAEIYESTPKEIEQFYPNSGPIQRDNPLFHSYGKRLNEWQATLAFLDVLFGTNPQAGYRRVLASRVFAIKDCSPRSHQICLKVRYKGKFQDPSEPETWLGSEITIAPPDVVSATPGEALQRYITTAVEASTAQLPPTVEAVELSQKVLKNRLNKKESK